MTTTIISCKTLEAELCAAMKETGVNYPVLWLESGLHNTPKKLNRRLAEELKQIKTQRVLLAMGFCGNSIEGLETGDYEMIVPRADDCISLLLGDVQTRMKLAKELSAYFLTEGWMKGERNLWVEYQYAVEKYGKEQAEAISEMMYGHYRTLALLDSKTQEMEPLIESTRIIADTFHMKQKVLPATLSWMKQLIAGPWEKEKFLVIPKYYMLSLKDLVLEK